LDAGGPQLSRNRWAFGDIMEYIYQGSLNKQNILNALGMRQLSSAKTSKVVVGIWILSVITGIIFGAASIRLFQIHEPSAVIFTIISLGYLIIGIKLFQQPKYELSYIELMTTPQDGTITEKGITNNSDVINCEMDWKYFTGFGEDGETIILLHGCIITIILIREFFKSEEQWNDVKSLINSKLQKTHGKIEKVINTSRITTIISIIVIIVIMLLLIIYYQ
jgi:hypothetical protein